MITYVRYCDENIRRNRVYSNASLSDNPYENFLIILWIVEKCTCNETALRFVIVFFAFSVLKLFADPYCQACIENVCNEGIGIV